MKKLLAISTVALLGLLLASPARAGHHGHRGGQVHRTARGTAHGIAALPVPPLPRIHSSFTLSYGLPNYAYPTYVAPAPVYYAPRPVYAAPACEKVWIPGRYAWNGGVRFYVAGHWTHHHRH